MIFGGFKNPRIQGKASPVVPVTFAVILLVVAGLLALSTHRPGRVRVSADPLNATLAFEGAQTGLNLALAHLRVQPQWATHALTATGSNWVWGGPTRRSLPFLDDPTESGLLGLEHSETGVVAGHVGSGASRADFRVRVGRVPATDDPGTLAVDESRRWVRIEAVGRPGDSGGHVNRCAVLDVLAQVGDLTDYLLYDAQDLVLGLGAYGRPDDTSIFAGGLLEGREMVLLGNLRHRGTRQGFASLAGLYSSGPIHTWNPVALSFQEPPGTLVDFPPSRDSRAGARMESARGNIQDLRKRKHVELPHVDVERYRRLAAEGGVDVSARPALVDSITLYPELAKVHLDFGATGDGDETLGVPYPKDFNGVVYCDQPVAVWGSPDRDITLVSAHDVYVCGDFNGPGSTGWRSTARRDWVGARQDYSPRLSTPGHPPLEGVRWYDMKDPVAAGEQLSTSDLASPGPSVAILSAGRIWMDMRHPARFLLNELRPYVKYRIALALSTDQAVAHAYVRDGARPQPLFDPTLAATGRLGSRLRDLFDLRGMATDDGARTRLYVTPPAYAAIEKVFREVAVDGVPADRRGVIDRGMLEGTPERPGLVDRVMQVLEEDSERHGDHPGTGGEPPPLALWNAPQGLYDLVHDERAARGPQAFGPFSDWAGDPARAEFQADELYMPQMTVRAMLVSSAARNDPQRNLDPTSMDRRADELGNGDYGIHYLSTRARLGGATQDVTSPLILRVKGPQIRLATELGRAPALAGGHAWPPLRRYLFDPALVKHPPPALPGHLEIVSFNERFADPTAFEGL